MTSCSSAADNSGPCQPLPYIGFPFRCASDPLTSAYLDYAQPVVVVLHEQPWGTHYKLRAYPFDIRDQFAFVSDLTVRGKLAIAEAGATEAVTFASLGVP